MRITRIIVTLVFAIMVAGFYSLYNYLNEGLEAQTLQATEESMVDHVHLLSALVENDLTDSSQPLDTTKLSEAFSTAKEHELQAKIYQMSKTQVGVNFYLTDQNGIVLYDSSVSENKGKDFSKKLDVAHTLQGKYGARSTRVNEDDPTSSIMYVAAPVRNSEGSIVGVVSLYKKQADVTDFIESRRRWILLSLLLIGAGIASFTVAVFVWLFRPLGKLTEYATAISEGARPAYPNLGKGREVNTLGSALKQMRSSLEGRDYMENYVRMLTHELKSPLSAIKGAAELLDEDMPVEKRTKFLKNIRSETQRSQQIIDGLLQLSKLESLDQLQTNHHLELAPILKEVVCEYSTQAQQKAIKLELHCEDSLTIQGDRMSILTALSNILTNAIEFSPSNTTIHLSATELEKHVEITVCDQGTGVPEYALDRVFEHFYSIARPTTEQKSSGLGLAFVKEVAQLHNGYVTIQNNPTKGATVTLAIQK